MLPSTAGVTENNFQNARSPKKQSASPLQKENRVHNFKISFFKAKLNKPFSQFSNYILRLKHNCLTSVYKSLLNI